MKQTFLNLYDRNVDGIYRYCYRMTGDKATAKTITEKAFQKMWDELDSVDSYELDTLLRAHATRLLRQHKSKTLQLLHNLSLKFS
jgi:DNA-directed RNA polymerase specialized sigma24 family protein